MKIHNFFHDPRKFKILKESEPQKIILLKFLNEMNIMKTYLFHNQHLKN